MNKFILLYMATPEQIAEWMQSPPADQEASMDAWQKWMNAHQDAFMDPGTPLGQNLQVTNKGTKAVSNGVCGYSLVWADDHEAAAKIVRDCPHLAADGAWIDIVAFVDMPG